MPDQNMLPFLFGAPSAPQSQFQPWQMSTGQAYGLNPMGIFANDIANSRQLYQLPTTTPTPPPVDPGTGGGTTPTIPGLPPGVTQDQMQQLNRLLYPRQGEHPLWYGMRTMHSDRQLPGLLEGLPEWYANLIRGSSQYGGVMQGRGPGPQMFT